MQKLITLNGESKVNSSKEMFSNWQQLDRTAAGLVFWKMVAEMFPGVKWKDIFPQNPKGLSGWNLWRKAKNVVGEVGSGIKDVATSTGDVIAVVGDKLGDWGGDTVRLAAEEEVQEAVSRGAAAYFSGGASESANAVADMFGSKKNPISEAGKVVNSGGFNKAGFDLGFGDIDPKWMAIGAASLIGVVLLTQKRN